MSESNKYPELGATDTNAMGEDFGSAPESQTGIMFMLGRIDAKLDGLMARADNHEAKLADHESRIKRNEGRIAFGLGVIALATFVGTIMGRVIVEYIAVHVF